ncbi:canalicular multispecific organic anion transporter 1 [Plakobranchus ocellatus]|uniref:Canalicular multispecific organic anion transporter 1 n=1 Tax=Plakobranchus ocellatus TaxID=259542 RepID=A0AAV3Z8C3_9GAST|nr:canalicular multispecific organic anion transporter 1 [Plakobranchus ocellatus]
MGFCGSKSNAMSVKEGVIQNECFVDVLNIIPHALLALVCIFVLTVWNHSVIGKLKVKTWVHYQGHSLRWICTLALITTIIVEIAEGFFSDLKDPDSTNYHAFVPACVAFLGALLSIVYYHNVEQWNSPRFLLLLLFYWPLAGMLKCIKALSIYRNDLTLDHLKVWLALIDIVFYLVLLLVELNVLRCQRYAFFKKQRRMRPPSDLENTKYIQSYVNFLSQAVYWWVTDLLIKGFKRPLNTKDLGKLPHSEKALRMYRKLQILFEEERFKATQRNRSPSLMLTLLRASWPMLLLSGLFRLIGDCLAFVGPLLIEQIVNYAYDVQEEDINSDPGGNVTKALKTVTFVKIDDFFRNGYVLSVVLFLASALQHTLLQNHHFVVIREGIRARTAVQTMVFSKTLKLSSLELSNGTNTVGSIMNHMSIDSTFIMFFYFFVHYTWALPIQVAVALFLMYYKMGISALIGGLFVILAGPAMYFLGVAMSVVQKKGLVHSDKRVKKINELLQGMKVIKLLAWERAFANSVIETRWQELSFLLPNQVFKGLMGFIGICAPVIGTLLSFALYPLFEDEPLTAGAAMSVLALFNLLQGPLQIMSILSASVANARVSVQRLLPFLTASEVAHHSDSVPSFSKSCSIGLDSGPSGHAMVEKMDSVVSMDGRIVGGYPSISHNQQQNLIELQPLKERELSNNRLSASHHSIASASSSKQARTPRQSPERSKKLSDRGEGSQKGLRSAAAGKSKEELTNSADSGNFANVMMSSSVGSASPFEHKRAPSLSANPGLSRNATSSELLDVKPNMALLRKSSAPALAVSEVTGDYKRRRHHSQRSVEEDDAALEDFSLAESQHVLEVQAGNFTWDLNKDHSFLKDITVKIPQGKLTVVVGAVGSGKSSLLSAFLGEMVQVSGNIFKSRNINMAYVSQRPWLLNASLKENILFGKPFVWRKYKKVISACALQPDIEQLPAGDDTEIGEKGVNLSGGQKQRISIARALYSEAELVLLDDPLSALDSHVGRQVLEEAILRRLVKRNRTVVMVTHYLQALTYAQQVIVMANGHIHFHGKVGEVKKFDPDLYETWRKAIRDAKSLEMTQKLESASSVGGGGGAGDWLTLERKQSGGSQSQLSVPGQISNLAGGGRKMSAMSVMTEASNEDAMDDAANVGDDEVFTRNSPDQAEDKAKLIKQEHRELGAVSLWVYLRYLQACSITLCLVSLLFQVFYHSLIVASNFWLSIWASESSVYARNMSHLGQEYEKASWEKFDHSPYLMTYVYLCVGSVLATLLGCLLIYHTGYVASRNIFFDMLVTVVRLPMRFFDTNPSGRILNRFSSDISAIDQRLGGHFENLLRCILFTLSAVVVNTVTTPYFLFAAIPFFIIYYGLQRFFRATARELQRLDSITKSPIFATFSETLNGLTVIRAYGVQTDFKRRAFRAIDANVTPFLFIHTANRWLGIRLDFMSCLLVFISCVASLSSGLHGYANPAFIGLCITYTLMVSGQLNWIVRISTEVEMSMNAVERVLEYTDMEVEQPFENEKQVTPPDSWPSCGQIKFESVTLSYDTDLEPVLINASFTIEGGEKVGVCGRTGSGKSSTILAIFRLLDLNEGHILIDGLDIASVDLSVLRSHMAIIPQDPVLFSGTLRFNLDANNKIPDERLWQALEEVQMKEVVEALPEQLDTVLSEGGDNFSVGQRQLLCMARAFLRDSKIIVMDEATSSIDTDTDNKIQTIVQGSALQGKTIITIAHRMTTIMNYDRIMVLEFGELKEFGPPAELASDEGSCFYSLLHGASENELK